MSEVTQLLNAAQQGQPHAFEKLLPLVYEELRKLAAQQLAQEKPGQTLQATALVHEAWLRLVPDLNSGQRLLDNVQNADQRRYFFAAAAQAMRRILIDRARRKQRRKHGGAMQRQELHPDLAASAKPDEELLALDEALNRLAQAHPLKAQLVELRYFGGMTSEEAAAHLSISPATADRHWVYARAWLQREIMAHSEK
ncbi:MAG TPA: ECF-type sigma factor [Gemmatales bacterium]|nr:ECF-type sigma factor [Gemmatales bacterium]